MKTNEINFEEHFTEKYKLYGEMLYKIAFLYTHNKADTEDILQDVFTKYFCLKKSFKSDQHEKAWFIRITQNKAIDYARKNKRILSELDNENMINIATNHQPNDIHQDIIKLILKLNDKYKTVIVLHYYYEYSVQDIAKTLNISQDNVKKRLQRARQQLKTDMEDYIND